MAANGSGPGAWLATLTRLATARNVDFVLVGGAAMALHGIPRLTMDIDLYVPATGSCLRAVLETLAQDCCLTCRQEGIEGLLDNPALLEGQWLTFATHEGVDVVDVFVESPELYYNLKVDAVETRIGDAAVKLASLSAIRLMKLDCGRPIDLSDAALIKEFLAVEGDET